VSKIETPPVPTPHEGEEQDEFISRCISTVTDEDPNRPKDQIIAMCYTSWREDKGEIDQTRLKRTHDLELRDLMMKIPRKKPCLTCPSYKDIRSTVHTESFEWIPTIEAELPYGARLYKVKALRSGWTYHIDWCGNKYKRHFSDDELLQSARTLTGASINLDHFQYPDCHTIAIDANFNKKEHDVEALVYCSDPYINSLYDEGHIVGASVEYGWRDEQSIGDALEQIGVVFSGLALVTDRYDDVPASPYTSVERLLTQSGHAFHSHKGVNILPSAKNKTGMKKMSSEEYKLIAKRLTGVEALCQANALIVKELQSQSKSMPHEEIIKIAMELDIPEDKIEQLRKLFELGFKHN